MEWSDVYQRLSARLEDEDAWAALEERVRWWARKDLGSDHLDEVDDVVQDTAVRVFVAFAGARGAVTFGGFVSGHYRNAKKGCLRKNKTVPLDDTVDAPAPEPPHPPDDAQAALEGCMALLSAEQRAVVTLRYYADLPYDKVATKLSITAGNARVIMSRAIIRLKDCMIGKGLSPSSVGS